MTHEAVDLPGSGTYWARVYAGVNPLTGKRQDLSEIVAVG